MSYRLFMSLRSPFARRVRLALTRLGAACDLEVIDVFQPTQEFLRANPLGLVPVLELPDGVFLPDSSTILDYLDETQDPGIWPKDHIDRVKVRVASTLAEGIMGLTVSLFLESQRKNPDPDWNAEFEGNLKRTLEQLHAEDFRSLTWTEYGEPTQAAWDLAVALEYLDLRLPRLDWRRHYPKFLGILGECRKHPAFVESTPPPA